MAARLRPASTGTMARCSAFRPGQGHRREHGAFAPASQDTPTSLKAAQRRCWSETSPPVSGPAAGPHPDPLVAVRSDLRPVGEDSESLACAGATAPLAGDAVTQQTRLQVSSEAAALARTIGSAYGARSCAPVASPCSPRPHTTHIVRSFRSWLASLLYSFSRRHSSLVSLFGAGIKLRTMWRCVPSGCFTVTVSASRRPPAARGFPSRGTHRASSQASFAPTPPLRMMASAARTSRVCLPQSPRPSPMLDPSRPRGIVAGK